MERGNQTSIMLSLMATVIVALGLFTDIGFTANRFVSDILVKQVATKRMPPNNILIIDIDEYSLKQMESIAGKWPWPRSIHAHLIEGLSELKPEAIVFDVLFSEHDIYRPDSDAYFSDVVAQNSNVYLAGVEVSSNSMLTPIKLKDYQQALSLEKNNDTSTQALSSLVLPWIVNREHWRVGSINFSTERDGVGRHYDVYRNLNGWHWLSLPAKVASSLNYSLPNSSSIKLNFIGNELMPFASKRYVDVFQILEASKDSSAYHHLKQQIENKIIIVGSTASGLYDSRVTPISHHYPAVSILATATENLMNQSYFTSVNIWAEILALCLVVLLFTASSLAIKNFRNVFFIIWPAWFVISLLLLLTSYFLALNNYLFSVGYLILSSFIAVVTVSMFRGISEYQQRKKLLTIFSRFIDPRLVRELIDEQSLELSTRSKSCRVTVLFSDIRGFTTLSESRSAEQVVTLLNGYFSKQVATIFKYGGTLDKFIGDAVMAFWGAPVEDELQSENALKAAIEMTENLIEFRQSLPDDLQDFDVGIGLHTGEAVVGMIGSEQRYDYTAIGDTVNLASRVEGLTKNKARILLTESCKNSCRSTFNWIPMGSFSVKGRSEPVNVYSIKGMLIQTEQ